MLANQLIENLAHALECESGPPRSAGRILGVPLTSSESYLSAPEIAARTGLSSGSASTMTRHLETMRGVRRLVRPGLRREHFAVADTGAGFLVDSLTESVQMFVDVLGRGAEMFGEGSAERRRIDGLAALYRFRLRELPALLQRFQAEQAGADTH